MILVKLLFTFLGCYLGMVKLSVTLKMLSAMQWNRRKSTGTDHERRNKQTHHAGVRFLLRKF